MDQEDPAIVSARKASVSVGPFIPQVNYAADSDNATGRDNNGAQNVVPFEHKLRGMIQSHNESQAAFKGPLSPKVSTRSIMPGRSPERSAAQTGQRSILGGPGGHEADSQTKGEARISTTANISAQIRSAAQERLSAATVPPQRVHQVGQNSEAAASRPNIVNPRGQADLRQSRTNTQGNVPNSSGPSSSGHHKRPNQQQRRQIGTLSLQDLQQPAMNTTTLYPSSKQTGPIPPTPPHLRQTTVPQRHQPSSHQYRQPPNAQPLQYHRPQHTSYGANYPPPPGLFGNGLPRYRQVPFHNPEPEWRNITQPQPQSLQFVEPIPQHRQLYNPHSDRRPGFVHNGEWMVPSALRAQSTFLDQLVSVEVPKAQIDAVELDEKEKFRRKLQEVCQVAIAGHEVTKGGNFDGSTVALECYGSVGSGFAMSGSDMDLALLSPASKPEPASPESELPRLLEKAFLDLGYGARLLTKTRIPIIRFCEKPTPELSEALQQARLKWENEKDEKTAPKTQKKHDKESTGQGRDAEAATETMKDAAGNGRTADVGSVEAVPDQQDHQIRAEEGVPAPTAAKGDLNTTESSLTTLVEAAALTPREDIIETSPEHSQGEPAENKTDSELIRLYGLAMSEGWFDSTEKSIIVQFISAVKSHGPDGAHEILQNARVQLQGLPNVTGRYREPFVNPLDLPKSGVGLQCDINFSNHLALHNTHLLKCYTLCDERVKPMVIFVKLWAKRRKINSPYHGTLSSYGYVLMVLHYLMNIVQPPLIPNLQRVPRAIEDTSPGNDKVIDGYTVRFWRDENDIRRVVASPGFKQNHTDTVGSLLRGFFQYFAHPSDGGFQWGTDVLSLRTLGGVVRKDAKGWTGAKTTTTESKVLGEEVKEIRHRYLFAIEDPFETEHNIARTVVHNGIIAIRDEIRRAHRIIQNQSRNRPMGDRDFLAEAENKEHLQYRYFGPLIPNFGKAKPVVKKENGGATASTETANTAASSSGTAPNLVISEKVEAEIPSSAERGREAISSEHAIPKQVVPERFEGATPASDETGREDTASKLVVSRLAEGVAPALTLTAEEATSSYNIAPELVVPEEVGRRIHGDSAA